MWLHSIAQKWCGPTSFLWAAVRAIDRALERVKLGLVLTSLCMTSALAGSSFGARVLLSQTRRHVQVQPLIKTKLTPPDVHAQESMPASNTNMQTQIAINSERISEIIKQNQASIDDRSVLHNQINQVASQEVNHYNTLNTRMDVNDARVMTIGWILGVLFTLSQAIVVFFHLDKRKINVVPPPQQAPPPPARRRRQQGGD